jgi:uncharacterized membrane protein YeiH
MCKQTGTKGDTICDIELGNNPREEIASLQWLRITIYICAAASTILENMIKKFFELFVSLLDCVYIFKFQKTHILILS